MNAKVQTKAAEVENNHPVVDKAAEKLHETVDTTAEKVANVEEKARETIAETSEKLDQTKDAAKIQGREIANNVKQYVDQNPIACLGIAFVAGLVSSRILRK